MLQKSFYFLVLFGLILISSCKTNIETKVIKAWYDESKQKVKHEAEVLVKDTTINHGELKSYFENGKLKLRVNYSKGKRDGEGIIYTENGNVKEIANFKEDMLNGKRQLFFPDTKQVMIEEHYKDENFEGAYKSYFENGKPKEDGFYSKGAMNGEWKYYYENGQQKELVFFKENKEDGPYKAWYKTGQLKTTGQYVEENEDGEWLVYHQNGILQEKGNYKNGWEEGKMEVFDSLGNMVKIIEYKNGRVVRLEEI